MQELQIEPLAKGHELYEDGFRIVCEVRGSRYYGRTIDGLRKHAQTMQRNIQAHHDGRTGGWKSAQMQYAERHGL